MRKWVRSGGAGALDHSWKRRFQPVYHYCDLHVRDSPRRGEKDQAPPRLFHHGYLEHFGVHMALRYSRSEFIRDRGDLGGHCDVPLFPGLGGASVDRRSTTAALQVHVQAVPYPAQEGNRGDGRESTSARREC